MQTKSYSGRGGGGPLQQSALKHCQDMEKQAKQKKTKGISYFFFSFFFNKCLFNKVLEIKFWQNQQLLNWYQSKLYLQQVYKKT